MARFICLYISLFSVVVAPADDGDSILDLEEEEN